MMENSNKPTERDRNIDFQHFPLQEWAELKQVTPEHIRTHQELSHTSNKNLGCVFHNRHTSIMMDEYVSTFIHIE